MKDLEIEGQIENDVGNDVSEGRFGMVLLIAKL
jgi:hypothetical protein